MKPNGPNPRQNLLATAPINKLIWTFALPAIISQVVNSMHNIVDQTFIGWGIGDVAIAATNIAFPWLPDHCPGLPHRHGQRLWVQHFPGEKDTASARKNLGAPWCSPWSWAA